MNARFASTQESDAGAVEAAVACPSCAHRPAQRLGAIAPGFQFAGQQLERPLPGGSLYRCPTCHLRFRWPIPAKAVTDALYEKASSSHWQYEAPQRYDWMATRAWLADRHPQGGAILDVGCFDGAFLRTLDASWTRYGIEPSADARERAAESGIELVGHDADDLVALAPHFDAVVAFDVAEHLPDPRRLLQQMAAVSVSGGSLILGTGNAEAASWRLMGSAYWYCTIAEHLAFISDSWCHAAASTLGLDLVRVDHFSHEADRTLGKRLHEVTANLLYRFAPALFGWLREQGVGDKDPAHHEALKRFPPTWTTASDHLLAFFRKP